MQLMGNHQNWLFAQIQALFMNNSKPAQISIQTRADFDPNLRRFEAKPARIYMQTRAGLK